MAHAFQNAESIKQAIFEELQNVLNPEKEVRNLAEEKIKQLTFTEGYGVYLAEFTMNQSFDVGLRQLACIMLTRYVEQHWDIDCEDAISCVASQQVKKTIKNILPNGLYDQNSKIRTGVAHTINAIALFDWPHDWSELFGVIIKCLGGNDNSICGGLLVLNELEYIEKEIKELGPVIISEIYKILDAEHACSDTTRAYAIRVLKSLLNTIKLNISKRDEKNSMLNLVLSNFMKKLLENLAINNLTNHRFIVKIEIVKLLTFADNEIPKSLHPYIDQILPCIWQLLTQTADAYVKIIVNATEKNPFQSQNDEDDELAHFTTLITQILQFVQCAVTGKFKSFIKNVLTDLIYITIVYMQITEEQVETWDDDPERFVDDEEDCGGDLSIRLSGKDVLLSLAIEFEEKVLPSLSEALARHISVAEAEKLAGNPHWWKIHEASMTAVGTFKAYILENEDKFDLVNYLTLIRSSMSFDSSPFLLGRCLWTLSEYSKSRLFNAQMLGEILEVCLNSLSADKHNCLKIGSVRAISGFVANIHKSEDNRRLLIVSKLESFVDGIVGMVAGSKCSVLALLLQTLTTIISFDDNFTASVHPKIIPLTIAMFLKYHEDPFILEFVQDMLKALCQNSRCLLPLQEKIIPTIVSILNLQGEQASAVMQDIALDVLNTIVKYSRPPLSAILVENAFPAAVHCVLRSDDSSIMLSGGECLRSFIYVSPEQVCAYKNGEGLNYIMQVTTMLLNPMNSELTAGQIGRLIITIIIKMGNLLGQNIDLLLKAVISKMQLVRSFRVIMSLVLTFAHLFLTQMEAVLNFLSTVPGPTGQPAIHFVFSNWLTRQQTFFGSYERKVTIMALCKLIEYGVTTQDTRLTSITIKDIEENANVKGRTRSQTSGNQQFVEMPVLMKMFKLLLVELKNLQMDKFEIEESYSETDDDDLDEDEDENAPNTSHQKYNTASDLFFEDDEDENEEDDQLMVELMKDPLFQVKMEDNLTKFLQDFSKNEHFHIFIESLTDDEKTILRSIQVEV